MSEGSSETPDSDTDPAGVDDDNPDTSSFMERLMAQVKGLLEDDDPDYEGFPRSPFDSRPPSALKEP